METNTNHSDYRQNNSGLLRFSSVPTSFLENFVEKNEKLSSGFCGGAGNSNNESGGSGFGGVSLQLPPQYPRQLGMNSEGFSMGMEHLGQGKISGSSLTRQNSSPAGLFSHLTSQNGYSTMRGIGSYRMAHDNGGNGDSSPSSSRLKNRTNFSSRVPRTLARITEVENENVGPNDSKVENSSGENLFFTSGFPFGSWNDSSNFAENFSSGIKRELDIDHNLFANTQISEPGNRPNILSHHLSLPKNSSEMEKLLQFQDTVPCKLRAKRGYATHPRSIAERVRRTRISERMRKLQELVPNMDKQTNTSDMLDLAVEYIKNLQKQYKSLSDSRANCKCSASRKVV